MGMAHTPLSDADRMRTVAYLTGGTDNPPASYLIYKVSQALSTPPWHLEALVGQMSDPQAQRWYGWALDFLQIEAEAAKMNIEAHQRAEKHQKETGRHNGNTT